MSDDLVWHIINSQFCSYKSKIKTDTFCRHPYNVTGLCNRTSCPLANSQYATIREHDGEIFLCMKTAERAHTPALLWEKVKLPNNYGQALQKIDELLPYWDEKVINRCKQRFTKIWQYLLRMRKLRSTARARLETINKKIDRREATREADSLRAANLEQKIKQELLARLKSSPEGIVNYDEQTFNQVLEEEGVPDDQSEEFIEDYSDDDMEDMDMSNFDSNEEFSDNPSDDEEDVRGDLESSSEEEGEDKEESSDSEEEKKPPTRKKRPAPDPHKSGRPAKRRRHVELEYEPEMNTSANTNK